MGTEKMGQKAEKVTRIEEQREEVSFADLDFSRVDLKLIDKKDYDVVLNYIYSGEQFFIYTDKKTGMRKKFVLIILCHKMIDKITREEDKRSYNFDIIDGEQKVLAMGFNINMEKNKNGCRSFIKKTSGMLEGSGFGEACFKKQIDFMEYISERDDLKFWHMPYKSSELSDEKWHRIFGTFLAGRGYQPIDRMRDKDGKLWPVEWEKYYPGAKKINHI